MNKINNFLWLRDVAWIEGAAIMIAVFIVASVGSFVDWPKDVQFVKSRI